MARVKIDFGIDLGTTNSAIAVMDNGEVTIIKSDREMKDTTPSCVQFNKKKQIRVGDVALHGVERPCCCGKRLVLSDRKQRVELSEIHRCE